MVPTSPGEYHSTGDDNFVASTEIVNGVSDNLVFVLRKKRHFCYETRPMPTFPSENHVIVVVCATGLCGSDVFTYSLLEPWRDWRLQGQTATYPRSRVCRHVQQCGSAVRSLKPGDRVALEPGIPCRTCEYCQSGRYNLYPDVHFAATPPHDGTLSRYYTMPESLCFKLPTHITLEEGALVEPVRVAVHCVKLAGITFGSSVLVLGAGPIGLLCCAVARAFGASKVVAVDIVAARLDFALTYAATATYQMEPLPPEENASRVLFNTGIGEGAQVVIDATGAEACISTGIHAMKRGGTFVQAGLGAAKINFPVAQLCSKEGIYRGSFRYRSGDYNIAVELLQHQKITVKELITHRYDFNEAETAFAKVEQRLGIKSMIYGPDTSHSSKL